MLNSRDVGVTKRNLIRQNFIFVGIRVNLWNLFTSLFNLFYGHRFFDAYISSHFTATEKLASISSGGSTGDWGRPVPLLNAWPHSALPLRVAFFRYVPIYEK